MVALMDPLDLVFVLMEGRERPMHVGGLQLFTPPADAGPDYIREIHDAAIEDARELHPLLARRPGKAPLIGRWQWETDRNIDLSYHVRHTGLPRPGRIRELLEVVGRMHGTLLDRNRPLWESHLIEGLDDGRFAVYTKIHHALLDGVSAMRLVSDALSTDPDETDMPPPWASRSRVRATKAEPDDDRSRSDRSLEDTVASLLEGVTAVARAGYDAVAATSRLNQSIREGLSEQAAVLPYQAPPSMFNVPITGGRRFAADSWALDRVRKVSKDNAATINDTVLAMCGGALRRYMLDHDALPDTPLVAMIPVSLRTDDTEAGGNAVGIALANLGTHTESPAERFDSVKESMAAAKGRFDGLSQGQMLAISAFMAAPMATTPLFRFEGFRRAPFNVVISNIPGPPEPRYWNGARLEGSYPLSIPVDGQAMNITVCSYAGSLDFGITADRNAVPQVQRLLDYLEESLQELEEI